MIKAPLDETNISPTTIIDDLTDCDNIGKDCTAVGYMYQTPVLFEYNDNLMRITFRKSSDLEKHKCTIRNYIKDMAENTERLKVQCTFVPKCVEFRFYWIEDNE